MNATVRWRCICPRGHTNWELPVDPFDRFECNPRHPQNGNDELVDRRTGDQVMPAQITAMIG